MGSRRGTQHASTHRAVISDGRLLVWPRTAGPIRRAKMVADCNRYPPNQRGLLGFYWPADSAMGTVEVAALTIQVLGHTAISPRRFRDSRRFGLIVGISIKGDAEGDGYARHL